MKKPDVKASQKNPSLAGAGGAESTWIAGVNCVYSSDDPRAKYRVAIKLNAGWKAYGHFNDLGLAAYVANIAILVEGMVSEYQLNSTYDKNPEAVAQWRARGNNLAIERRARALWERHQKEKADQIRQERERRRQYLAQKQKEDEVERERKNRKADLLIAKLSDGEIERLLESGDLTGEGYRRLRKELGRRGGG